MSRVLSLWISSVFVAQAFISVSLTLELCRVLLYFSSLHHSLQSQVHKMDSCEVYLICLIFQWSLSFIDWYPKCCFIISPSLFGCYKCANFIPVTQSHLQVEIRKIYWSLVIQLYLVQQDISLWEDIILRRINY